MKNLRDRINSLVKNALDERETYGAIIEHDGSCGWSPVDAETLTDQIMELIVR